MISLGNGGNQRRKTSYKLLWAVPVISAVIVLTVGLVSLNHLSSAAQSEKLSGPLYQESTQPYIVDPESIEDRVIKVVEKVSPAVVSISTERTIYRSSPQSPFQRPGDSSDPFEEFFRRFFENYPQQEFKQKGLGSGVILNEDGYILTNEHVLHGADPDEIKVTLPDERIFPAKIVEKDEESDLALLKIEGDHFPSVVLGDSDQLKTGQFVVALGNPFGFVISELNHNYEPTVTVGVISAKNRAIRAGSSRESKIYQDLIQTDASINPGNSGGPLVNLRGEVIGINAAILSPSGGSIGIGFAIPVNKAKKVIESLITYGEVRKAWIGIYLQDLTPELSEQFGVEKGVLVPKVFKDSPAGQAGLEAGDIVIRVDGVEINSGLELQREVVKKEIGEVITLTVVREGKEMTFSFPTAKRSTEVAKKVEPDEELGLKSELLGIRVQSVTPELKDKYSLENGEEGVVITEVDPGGPAAKLGFGTGDIIREVNRKSVSNLDDFQAVMDKVKPGETVLLRVSHGAWTLYFTLPTSKD